MAYAVCVPEAQYAWLVKVHVREGQSIAPEAEIADVMLPDGVVHTLLSDVWGIVAHVEKGVIDKVNDNEDDELDNEWDDPELLQKKKKSGSSDGRSFSVFSTGDVICHIARRRDNNNRNGELHPRQSITLRRLRMGM